MYHLYDTLKNKVRHGQSTTFEHVLTTQTKQVLKYDVAFKNILKRKLKTKGNRERKITTPLQLNINVNKSIKLSRTNVDL